MISIERGRLIDVHIKPPWLCSNCHLLIMGDAGYVDVKRHFYWLNTWALNMWPQGKEEKLVGTWAQQSLLDGVEAMSMALLTRGLNWSRGQVEMFLAGVRNDLTNCAVHSYVDV
jgi:hypothetical protein